MTQKKRRKKVSGQRSNSSELNDLLIQTVRTGVALADRGIVFAEEIAHKRDLFKSYPYLDKAFVNVKNVVCFLQSSLKVSETKEAKKDERTKRKKGRKKISKQKTVRHSR